MNPQGANSRNFSDNTLGNNVTIYQGDVHNQAADHIDQCLADLRPTDPREDKKRIQQTKGGILKESYDWIFENETFKQWRDDEQNRLLWIKGDPGKGKTMLLCGLIDELTSTRKLASPADKAAQTLLSFFFCQGTDSRINNATAVLRGLIYLIIVQEPSLIACVREKYKHAGKDLFLGINAWVALSDIFENILQDPIVKDIIFIVDALDECETDSAKLLDFITQHASLPHVRWVVSSRNILSIQQRLESHVPNGILSLELKANAESISQAVDTYIEHRVSGLRSIQHNQGHKDELRDALKQKANGTFLWVSLVMKELEDVQSWEVMEVVQEMPMDLTAVYRRMIEQIRNQRRGNAKFCWKILSTVFTAYRPLSLGEVGTISDLPKEISEHDESISKLVTMCGSFLTIREDTVYFIHHSAKDFLSAETFERDAAQRHAIVFKHSIAAISKLSQNIYHLPDFGFRPKNVPPPNLNPLVPMRYSCFFWADHFCDSHVAASQSETDVELDEELWLFLKNYALRWLESISLLDGLSDGLHSIQKLLREFNASPQLSRLLHSIEKFTINNAPILDRAPLQIYGSALVFSPISSLINERQWGERLPFIKDIRGLTQAKDALLQTLEGHRRPVTNIYFSLDGKMIASCCEGGTIRVWDATTGAIRKTLTSRGNRMLAVALEPDCKTLLLASLKEYPDPIQIKLIAVSLENTTKVARLDNAIQLDEAAAYAKLYVLKETVRNDVVASFSADGKILAARSGDDPIELWDTQTGVHLQTFQSAGQNPTAIAFSPDSKTMASGDNKGTVQLWEVATGICFQRFNPLGRIVFGIAFQPHSGKLALSLGPQVGFVLLLDTETGAAQATRIRHGQGEAIVLSPDGKTLVSGCADSRVRLWDVEVGMQKQIRQDDDLNGQIQTIAFSPDGKILASTSYLKTTIQLWDATTGERWQTIECPWVPKIQFLPNGQRLWIYGYGQLRLWDIATGHWQQYLTMGNERRSITIIAVSPDGSKLASAFHDNIILVQEMATGNVLQTLERPDKSVTSMAFSPDGRTLAAAYLGKMIFAWDVATGTCLQSFSNGLPDNVWCKSLTFLPNGRYLSINYGCIKNWLKPDEDIREHDLLLVTDEWITKGGKPLLWLPKDYRSMLVAVHGNVVAIGHKSGVAFFYFTFKDQEKYSISKGISQYDSCYT